MRVTKKNGKKYGEYIQTAQCLIHSVINIRNQDRQNDET